MRQPRTCALSITALLAALVTSGHGQTRLSFEVASIRPSDPKVQAGMIRPLPGGQTYVANNLPLKLIIRLMFQLNDAQVAGGPDWIETDRWDIKAKAANPSNLEQLHEMFRNFLVERFKLRYHTETREQPMLALVVDKSGSKMKLNDSPNMFDIPMKPAGPGKATGERVPMSYLAWFLSQRLNRPVVDKTGLDKFYDFTLEFAPEPPPGAPAAGGEVADQDLPDLMTALRQQLGLKLEPQKGPVPVMVIDHIEKPSEN